MLCIQCGHSNPDGASHCASCAAPLPVMCTCPSCQELVSTDACFCAHCGATLQPADLMSTPPPPPSSNISDSAEVAPVPATEVVDLSEVPAAPPTSEGLAANIVDPALAISQPPDLLADDDAAEESAIQGQAAEFTIFPEADSLAAPMSSDADGGEENSMEAKLTSEVSAPLSDVPPSAAVPPAPPSAPSPNPVVSPSAAAPPSAAPPTAAAPTGSLPTDLPVGATVIQQPSACLVHVRSDTPVTIPIHLELVHLGKPNDRVPPDIDLSGFPDSDVVSRVHADLRLEGDGYYLQDSGSANGTYVNNQALRTGDRYRLRTGDRVSFGKEDKVSFIFKAG